MTEGELVLVGVAIGGLLTPVTQGVGYLVRRHFEQGDQQRDEQRQVLARLQDAILELTQEEESFAAASERERAIIHLQMCTANDEFVSWLLRWAMTSSGPLSTRRTRSNSTK